ncbi:MAG: hypothetical protein SOZ80_04490 [Prevotella sp.]|uniref:hypothetical protein n=1 Tax=Prevotella sp. TaxID=59823 RepID=UPI002A2656AF|nr:hypothetical protein [Prevotella sp.]MDD7319151.1 hypothetical protein [Prevotellaceae bacterium]MDY4020019.1 hypothetical protein [Prevotella sp.]
MKSKLLILVFSIICCATKAQEGTLREDFTPFKGKFYNEEYQLFMVINLADKDVVVAGQEILGELDGYFGTTQTGHVWLITSSETEGNTATIEVVNNYGSEDFTATLTMKDDGTYEFRHIAGSTFKFSVNGKWKKIPARLVFSQ